ncbi:MAG: FCSD flavin-binding domain-containing protein [Ectothiorhodospira sp.]
MNRRDFIRTVGAGGAAAALSACGTTPQRPRKRASVVVIGGGPGGATAAKYLRRFDPDLDVTLVEPTATYHTCFGSNWVLGGMIDMDDIALTYGSLQDKHGVRVVKDRVETIEADTKRVRLAGGETLAYEKLVVAPGMEFRYDSVEGYGPDVEGDIPHAWKAGKQTRILRDQLRAMDNGGVFVIVPPGNPYRCPPGPYERASLVAHYFKEEKPRSKVLILDRKDKFSKQGLFMDGWKEYYGDMIEWIPASEGGLVDHIDPKTREVFTEDGFTRHRADVLNVIPSQKAGRIAHEAGLTDDTGWCPVDQLTFRSREDEDIYVIGDSSIAGAMPKSAHSANTQGKTAAAAIVRAMDGEDMLALSTVNTCYSLVAPDYGISVAAVYRYQDGEIAQVPDSGGLSADDAPEYVRRLEARYARGWYDSITEDSWG